MTRNCNKKCSYCSNYGSHLEKIEVDIDYFKYVLSLLSNISNLRLEISGGEPGTITNLEDCLDMIYECKNIQQLSILSNGLVRSNYPHLLDSVTITTEYYEHIFVDDLFDKIDTQYGKSLFNYILVIDEKVINVLLNNISKLLDTKVFTNDIKLKFLTQPKSKFNNEYISKLRMFYKIILSKEINISKCCKVSCLYHLDLLDRLDNIDYETRLRCSHRPSMSFLDIENKKIGACSMHVSTSELYDITQYNISRLIDGELFKYNTYCNQCIKYTNYACKTNKIWNYLD